MSEWISTEIMLPDEGEPVLVHIVFQRMLGGTWAEDDVVMIGWRENGDWAIGHKYMLWDYAYNIGFTDDDVVEWAYIPSFKEES